MLTVTQLVGREDDIQTLHSTLSIQANLGEDERFIVYDEVQVSLHMGLSPFDPQDFRPEFSILVVHENHLGLNFKMSDAWASPPEIST